MMDKERQSPADRAKISNEIVEHLRGLVKNLPVEVLGHIEARGVCCGNGTVAIVKIDRGDPPPKV